VRGRARRFDATAGRGLGTRAGGGGARACCNVDATTPAGGFLAALYERKAIAPFAPPPESARALGV